MSKYVIGVTGASAQPLAKRTIELLLKNNHEVHLVLSRGAYEVWQSELGIQIPGEPKKQKTFWREYLNIMSGELICYKWNDNSSAIASGSFKTKAMIIIPCTMGTIGRIASGYSLNLLERCADVHLKESRQLLICPRESPMSIIHLKNLTKLAIAGAKIVPPIPAWYTNPKTLDDIIDFIVIRLFDLVDEELLEIKRWEG